MKETNTDSREKYEVSRRKVLSNAGIALIATGIGVSGTTTAEEENPSRAIDDFYVTGEQITKATITPEEVVIEKRKISPDLEERYGREEVIEETTVSRRDPTNDDLPKTAERKERREWKAYYARGGEWASLFESEPTELVISDFTGDGLRTQESYPSFIPKYYHAEDDGGYELKGPVNILSNSTADADDLASEIADEGGSLWNTFPIEWGRHMYLDGEWVENEASVASGPFGIIGRTHGRIWSGPVDFYGIVAAHIDDAVPHEAVSYLEAEEEITDMMDGEDDLFDAENDQHPGTGDDLLDHNGRVSLI